MNTEELKKRESLLKAVVYVAAGLVVITIGYAIFLLLSHRVDSLGEWAGRNLFVLGGFGASLLFGSYALKKVRTEIQAKDRQEAPPNA